VKEGVGEQFARQFHADDGTYWRFHRLLIESYRTTPGGPSMFSFWQDLRYAGRNLRKIPGFALVAMITLALGIGASTAIFSVIENVLMEPFPYPDAQHFVSIQIHDSEQNRAGGRGGYSGPEFLDYVAQNHVFDRVIANDGGDVLYTYGEGTDRFSGGYVTPGTFEFLGMPALVGRAMQPADYEPGAPPVFVLRYKVWVNRFNADPSILNKTFVLNGTARTLVGVMPPRFGWGILTCGFQKNPAMPIPLRSSATTATGFLWGISSREFLNARPKPTLPSSHSISLPFIRRTIKTFHR
jgi:hypothetical protein